MLDEPGRRCYPWLTGDHVHVLQVKQSERERATALCWDPLLEVTLDGLFLALHTILPIDHEADFAQRYADFIFFTSSCCISFTHSTKECAVMGKSKQKSKQKKASARAEEQGAASSKQKMGIMSLPHHIRRTIVN